MKVDGTVEGKTENGIKQCSGNLHDLVSTRQKHVYLVEILMLKDDNDGKAVTSE